jgi:hypothetical protein
VYGDVKPCRVCGAEVRLEPREPDPEPADGPVGPSDGVVGTADPTVDRRVCTNPDCPSHEDPEAEV